MKTDRLIIINTYDPKKEKEVFCGKIVNDTFIRKVNRKKHFMRKYHGYAEQKNVIKQLLKYKVKYIKLKTDEGEILVSKLSDWTKYAIVTDEGHGKQYFMNVNRMKIKGTKNEVKQSDSNLLF